MHVVIRFYEELNDFLKKEFRKVDIPCQLQTTTSVKDLVESYNLPHTEVDLILVNGHSVDFEYRIENGDRIAVYPVFENFDIKKVTKLRPRPLRKTTFVVDVHLGKLARALRMCGFDTLYRNDFEDEEIVQISCMEKRIVLTRDLGILKNSRVTHGYFVRNQEPNLQIQEVIRHFQLENCLKPLSRCIECNGKIVGVEKTAIDHLLEVKTRQHFHDFFQCTGCKKVYWEGSHYEKMMDRFKTNT